MDTHEPFDSELPHFSDWLCELSDAPLSQLLQLRGIDAPSFSILAARLSSPAGMSLYIHILPAPARALLTILGEDLAEAHENGEKIKPVVPPELVERAISRLSSAHIPAPSPESSIWKDAFKLLTDAGLIYAGYPHPGLLPALRRVHPVLPEEGFHFRRSSLEAALATISPKEKKVLDTVSRAGIGHSSKIDQPGHPIRTVIDKGFLLQLDERTVQAPWMLREIGQLSFEEDYLGEVHIPHPRPTPDVAAVADLLWLVHGLLHEHIELKLDETVGLREYTRLEKIHGERVHFVLPLLESAGFFSPAMGVYQPTTAAEEFLSRSWAGQWAFLIERWAQNSLVNTALIRSLRAGTSLFYYCPEAAISLSTEAHRELYTAATMLGLIIENTGTEILSHEEPLPYLESILPTGAMLLAQADMTIMSTGPISLEQERMLRHIANLESAGIASVWRVDTQNIEDAINEGIAAEDMLEFLQANCPEVPETISYQIQDRARAKAELRVGRASTYVAGDVDMIERVADYLESKGVETKKLSTSVLVSEASPASMQDWLREGGFMATVDGKSRDFHRLRVAASGPVAPDLSIYPPKLSPEELEDTIRTLRANQEEEE
ncbi:MAG: helicase-associated domain-containing protein [Corynebacterium sp.]|nr:helicase-associated domain-containing protein [Corynebacterium sp.]